MKKTDSSSSSINPMQLNLKFNTNCNDFEKLIETQ